MVVCRAQHLLIQLPPTYHCMYVSLGYILTLEPYSSHVKRRHEVSASILHQVLPFDHNLHHPVEIASFEQTSNVAAKFAGGRSAEFAGGTSAEFAGGTRTPAESCGGYTRGMYPLEATPRRGRA